MNYVNITYDSKKPKQMAIAVELWRQSTHANKSTIPHILKQWREGKCYLRVNQDRLKEDKHATS